MHRAPKNQNVDCEKMNLRQIMYHHSKKQDLKERLISNPHLLNKKKPVFYKFKYMKDIERFDFSQLDKSQNKGQSLKLEDMLDIEAIILESKHFKKVKFPNSKYSILPFLQRELTQQNIT